MCIVYVIVNALPIILLMLSIYRLSILSVLHHLNEKKKLVYVCVQITYCMQAMFTSYYQLRLSYQAMIHVLPVYICCCCLCIEMHAQFNFQSFQRSTEKAEKSIVSSESTAFLIGKYLVTFIRMTGIFREKRSENCMGMTRCCIQCCGKLYTVRGRQLYVFLVQCIASVQP